MGVQPVPVDEPLAGEAFEIDPTGIVLTTGIDYQRRAAARFVWRLVRPLHRLVARYLLAYAASSVGRAGATGDRPALPLG